MRYLHFANQAEKEKFNNMARLFRPIAHAEYIHAGDHYRELKHLEGGYVANSMAAFGPGDSRKNLKLAIAGETFEIEEMYPVYMEVANIQVNHPHLKVWACPVRDMGNWLTRRHKLCSS